MKKQSIIDLCVGITVGAAAAVGGAFALRKVVGEIKTDLNKCSFISPNGQNIVTLTYGTSKFALGLTYIKVQASVESGDDDCKLVLFAQDGSKLISGEWQDENNFKLLVGKGKCKQCCDVNFEGEEIIAKYYLCKEETETELVETETEPADVEQPVEVME